VYPGMRQKLKPLSRAAASAPPPVAVTEQQPGVPFASWAEFLALCGLQEYTETYETLFARHAIELDQVPDFNSDVLKELKIKMGHIMKMMKVVNSLHNPTP